jgi:DNA primase small subunit
MVVINAPCSFLALHYTTMVAPMDIDDSKPDCSPEVMRSFYQHLYPYHAIFAWLNQKRGTASSLFTNREFAFSLPGDVYLRYQSFTSAEELKAQMIKLIPTRFEIGPVYTARVRDDQPPVYHILMRLRKA